MVDITYFEEDIQVLVTPAVLDSETGAVITPAVYETQQQIRSRPQSITHHDIERVMAKHSPAAPPHLSLLVDLEQETIQWQWFDSYQAWLIDCENIDAWNTLNAGIFNEGEADEYTVSSRTYATEPVRPTIDTSKVATCLAEVEQEWCITELNLADIQIAFLIDGDTRQSPPPSDWYTYRKELRNRVTGGVIIGDPSPSGRPVRPAVT